MTNSTISPLGVLKMIRKHQLLSKYLHLKGNKLYSGTVAKALGFGKKKKRKPKRK